MVCIQKQSGLLLSLVVGILLLKCMKEGRRNVVESKQTRRGEQGSCGGEGGGGTDGKHQSVSDLELAVKGETDRRCHHTLYGCVREPPIASRPPLPLTCSRR